MGKKIGIKLADGTFYPIMEDGVPQKKLMELTTVQDNQTTASIDLYRSESGTMEDAEYVDTLELSEFAPHPGGETNITFTLKLDENNMLDAEVVEPESGKTSATKSDLVNLPAEKKLSIVDDATDVSDGDFEQPSLPEAPVNGPVEEPEEQFAQEDFSQPAAGGGAGIADFELPDFDVDDYSSVDSLPSRSIQESDVVASEDTSPSFEDSFPEESDAISETPATIDDLPDFGDVSLDLADNSSEEVPAFDLDSLDLDDFASVDSVMDEVAKDEDARVADEQEADGSNALLAAGVGAAALVASGNDQDDEDDSHLDALLGKDDAIADSSLEATSLDLPDFDESSVVGDDTIADNSLEATSLDLPDFDEGSVVGDDTIADSSLEATSLDLPDFDEGSVVGDDTAADSSLKATSLDLPDFGFGNDDEFTHQDTTVYEDSLPDFSKFELPDFDAPVRNDFSFGEESGLFNENDFNDPAFYTNDAAASSASPLDFSGLYDERETELKQQESRRRRGGLAVAICVICALICVGILLFILFLLPTQLAGGRINDNQVSVTDSHTVTVSQQEMEAVPDSTAAVEDVIVIVETPAVVPAPPPQAAKASEVARYQVKWGGTLWDIAQSYYNNPWLYKRIATANNIKNPDHIVAGTILVIPPQ